MLSNFYSYKELSDPNIKYTWFEYAKIYKFRSYVTEDFDLVNAIWLAELARVSYILDEERVYQEIRKAGFHEIRFFHGPKTDTQAIVIFNDSSVILVFRGTQITKLKDFKSDFNAFQIDSDIIGSVHRGFKEALDEIWIDIYDYIHFRLGYRKLWITGHSLGAALATIAAARFSVDNIAGLYTYGSPRVGNEEFSKYVQDHVSSYRIVNHRDIITKMPPPGLYKHIGNIIYLDKNGKIYQYRKRGLSFFIDKFFDRIGLVAGIIEHDSINYANILKMNLLDKGGGTGTY